MLGGACLWVDFSSLPTQMYSFDDVEGSVEENGEDFNAEDRAADTSGSFVLRRHGGDCALSVWEAGSNEMNVQTPDLEFSEEVLAVPLLVRCLHCHSSYVTHSYPSSAFVVH